MFNGEDHFAFLVGIDNYNTTTWRKLEFNNQLC